jgi:hypothetical protein
MWEEDAYTCSYIKAPGGEINIKPMSCEWDFLVKDSDLFARAA